MSSPARPPSTALPNISQRSLLSPSPTPHSTAPSPSPAPPATTTGGGAFNPPLEGAWSGSAAADSPARQALDVVRRRDGGKVIILFKAIGSAPLMRQNQFKVTGLYPFQFVVNHLRKTLGTKPTEPLFLYINNSFSPAPDDPIVNLYKCFKSGNQLIVNYSTTQAWG